jgi:protoporphyrinogen oxidase
MANRGPVIVLGGGVAGLAAGYYLSRAGIPVTVVERAPHTGGLCGSFQSDDFTLDYGPHKLYSVVPGILDEIRRILGDDLIEHRKKNRIRLLDRYLEYPLKLGNLLPLLGPIRSMRLGLGYAGAMAGGLLGRRPARSYEDYLVQRFGRGVFELVFEPLARKVWGDPAEIAAELAEARVPAGGPGDLLLRLLKLKETTENEDAPYFYYPRGGFGVFPQRLAEGIAAAGGRVITGATPVALERAGARIQSVEVDISGQRERLVCETLVSSIPIHTLAGLVFPDDATIAEDAARLRLRDLVLVYVFLGRDRVMEDHWIFFPEQTYPFNRVFEQKAMSPELGPEGRTAVCCDLTCDAGDPTWEAPDDTLIQRCADAMLRVGLAKKGEHYGGLVKRFRSFYPMYTVGFRDQLGHIYDRLRPAENLLLTGRLGMFNYNNSDHCLDMGRFLADGLDSGASPSSIWRDLEQRVLSYRIID